MRAHAEHPPHPGEKRCPQHPSRACYHGETTSSARPRLVRLRTRSGPRSRDRRGRVYVEVRSAVFVHGRGHRGRPVPHGEPRVVVRPQPLQSLCGQLPHAAGAMERACLPSRTRGSSLHRRVTCRHHHGRHHLRRRGGRPTSVEQDGKCRLEPHRANLLNLHPQERGVFRFRCIPSAWPDSNVSSLPPLFATCANLIGLQIQFACIVRGSRF